mmetsp:Transcript_68371/g.154814  ORF Transcript_68371/g.154814 Transcript_68371/m.154814 type:complete len:202 (-) Transcript_68371:80-685(-)
MRPFNQSSICSNGSGRDTYVMMQGGQREGVAELASRTRWMSQLRGVPPSQCSHMKGHETWYTPASRGRQWSPPAPRLDGESPQRMRGEPMGEVSEQALQRMKVRATSSLRLRSNYPPSPFLSATRFDSDDVAGGAGAVQLLTSPSRPAVSGKLLNRSSSSPDCTERAFQANLTRRATASFRLRAKPQAAAFSFSRSERLTG